MCGIFLVNTGEINSNISIDLFKYIGSLSESRGKEASGWFYLDKGNLEIYKSDKYFSNRLNTMKLDELKKKQSLKWMFGHTRLKTHGEITKYENNQPCISKNTFIVHNGIVTNYQDFNKSNHELDSQIIADLIESYSNSLFSIEQTIEKALCKLKGEVSIGGYSKFYDKLFIYSNTGSIYYLFNKNKLVLFSSEQSITSKAAKKLYKNYKLKKIEPNHCLIFNQDGLFESEFIVNTEGEEKNYRKFKSIQEKTFDSMRIPELSRCKKCILPETVPFIEFDSKGICNYCINYEKHIYKDIQILKEKIKNKKIVCGFSGGRDSSFGLYKLYLETNAELIATTYDWGMVTDLARRNQARVVGKLGIEHIWVSAKISKKRKNIRKNLIAWLSKPHPGTIPVLMAGDKVWQIKLNKIKKQTNSDYIAQFECPYEQTYFKYGFAGIKPRFKKEESYSLSIKSFDKLKLFAFYISQALFNYRLINQSLFDSIRGFYSFYYKKRNYIFPYNYFKFEENEVNHNLENYFQWEFDDEIVTSWRIGDETSFFYNFLYYEYAGFTENDFFRSNLIREGLIDRTRALYLVNRENQTSLKRVEEYLMKLDLEFKDVESDLNKFFENSLVKTWINIKSE